MDLTLHSFFARDGARLTFRLLGSTSPSRPPLICVPGGPMLDSDYLGDLGGLHADRALALLDPRGTGSSGGADDPSACRCDRLADDLEALREHLGEARIELLGHSAGANVVYRYAERSPGRVCRLVLVAPSVRGLDLEVPNDARRTVARLRSEEPWFADAMGALEAAWVGTATAEQLGLLEPFSHGCWDDATRAYVARMDARRDPRHIQAFGADGAFDATSTRDALSRLDAPVLVLAGGLDVGVPPALAEQVARLFANADFVVQPGAGHFPWRNGAERFRRLVAPFLA
ncbi:alpha/beta fold hydrolase [Nocardioides sp. zg-1228]|uniref:alpha/beta fold hydrolase n=1 Tax=Nocardioides sp. zg-1228 TaxID=2763008 RepID=UPI00164337C9|nr:alpha/beta hydrolase [Nocardioides sp. zg-1228]MBC2934454.1 alpha/beta hydrolase [Nocardioides sp. zg-1228]QSF59220.1 alpha/beta hydrolase [Nocardioides sp. zg-1228]